MFFVAEKNLINVFKVGRDESGHNDDGYEMIVDGKFELSTVFSFL